MKVLVSMLLVLMAHVALAQGRAVSNSEIDYRALSVDASNTDTLAQKLIAGYTTDRVKVRAIFRWITDNITYKVQHYYYRPLLTTTTQKQEEPEDSVLKPLSARVAETVLKKREAVCDGYARLFKTLCDAAGVPSVIINGYARTNMNHVGTLFRANHSWNAVYLDSAWHLLDVTWASGYISYRGDEFIKSLDESYYLTPPRQFIRDHYPEDLQWTLLPDPPTLEEFRNTPFKYTAYTRHHITSFKPARGIIEASLGDSIRIELETDDDKKNFWVTDSLFRDTAILYGISTAPAQTAATISSKKVAYTYKVESDTAEWLNVVFNDEVILRYKLKVRKSLTAER